MELQKTLQKNTRNLATYDFSTLYISIPHDKLKEKLEYVINKAFKGKKKKKLLELVVNSQSGVISSLVIPSIVLRLLKWLIGSSTIPM